MKKLTLLFILLTTFVKFSFTQVEKIEVIYQQPDVFVVVDEKLIGLSPKRLKVNFAISSDIYFFKKGYYTHKIELDPDKEFNKLTINLTKKPNVTPIKEKRLLKQEKLIVSKTVTNMTRNDIQEILDEHFIKHNYYIGKSADLFPDAVNEIKNSRYKIACEVLDNKQIKSVYTAPRFMMAYIKFRWTLLDSKSNKVVLFESTEGMYFVKLKSSKNIVASEMITKVMKKAIEEAQTKFLNNKKFIDLVVKD